MDKEFVKTGTTTVGIVCRDGVVLAADKRATAGHMIVDKEVVKLIEIAPNMAITIAGLVSDAQLLSRVIRAEIALKSTQQRRHTTVKEAAHLLASLQYANIRRPSMVAGIVGFMLAGQDDDGVQLYDLGIDGSMTKHDKFESTGSGSVFALGVLESQYKQGLSCDEGIELATKAVNASLQRDSASGNGIDIWVINEKGVNRVVQKKINTGLL